jgi:hypothetical protein
MATKVWSEEQLAIYAEFETGKGHLVVEACAGTGKTTTCVEGIGRAPEELKAYVAFNKKNVEEMSERIEDPTVEVRSLNGLGFVNVLPVWKGVRPDSNVEGDRIKAVVSNNAKFRNFQYSPIALCKELVAFAKNTCPFATIEDVAAIAAARGLEPEGYLLRDGWTQELCVEVAFMALQASKIRDAKGRISFDDQVWLPVVMGWVKQRFDLVVVDEAQDMNYTQLELAKRSCRDGGRIIIVGDPRQAIYAFRGADVNGMARLKTELNAKTLTLSTTYRCPQRVVELARKLVPAYQAAPTAPEGVIGTVHIEKLVDTAQPGDAILSRTNAPLTKLCLAFLKRGVRAYIEGRDIGAKLLAIHKGIRAASIADYMTQVGRWADDRVGKVDGDDDAAEAARTNIIDMAATLRGIAEECASSDELENLLRSLFVDSSEDKDGRPAVVLSSVHKAKGLEWTRTFLIEETFKRCTWTSIPSEINNITYVAVTRCKAEMNWVTGYKAPARLGKRSATAPAGQY